MSHGSSTHDIRHENDNSSTAHHFSCWVYRLKRSRNSRYGISGADDAVDVWAIVRSCRRAPRTAAAESLTVWSCPTINREPTRCSGLADHGLYPGAVAARLGSKQRPRAARAEEARVGRWWAWLDSNGVTLFVQQYDRCNCWELLLARINTWYLVRAPVPGIIRGTCGLRIIRKKWNACFVPKILHSYKEVKKWSHKQKGQKGFIFESKKILHNYRPRRESGYFNIFASTFIAWLVIWRHEHTYYY